MPGAKRRKQNGRQGRQRKQKGRGRRIASSVVPRGAIGGTYSSNQKTRSRLRKQRGRGVKEFFTGLLKKLRRPAGRVAKGVIRDLIRGKRGKSLLKKGAERLIRYRSLK
jgi:hypothetical protein